MNFKFYNEKELKELKKDNITTDELEVVGRKGVIDRDDRRLKNKVFLYFIKKWGVHIK